MTYGPIPAQIRASACHHCCHETLRPRRTSRRPTPRQISLWQRSIAVDKLCKVYNAPAYIRPAILPTVSSFDYSSSVFRLRRTFLKKNAREPEIGAGFAFGPAKATKAVSDA